MTAISSPTQFSATWDILAKQLGIKRKTLQRWRKQFGTKCPIETPEGHDVAAWRHFAGQHGLKVGNVVCRSVQQASVPGFDPRELLFEFMQQLHSAFADGKVGLKNYVRMGDDAMEHLCVIAELWRIPDLDITGWRKLWDEIKRSAFTSPSKSI